MMDGIRVLNKETTGIGGHLTKQHFSTFSELTELPYQGVTLSHGYLKPAINWL